MTLPLLAGTLPVRAFSPTQFFGTIAHDGQPIRVAALAATPNGIALLSLVGYDTSVSATLAKLHLKEHVSFVPAEGVTWAGPRLLERMSNTSYTQFPSAIAGTREKHVVLLPMTGHIGHGLLHPQDISEEAPAGAPRPPVTPSPPRIILGNDDETTPHVQSFLGHLRALRVIFLREADGMEVADRWASVLWSRGLEARLITAIPALGIKAWSMTSDVRAWSTLVSQGVRDGSLPWRAPASIARSDRAASLTLAA